MKYCGNSRCSTSTGIDGSTTHGWGEPDPNGYFDFPCFICARHYEKSDEGKTHWPFPLKKEPPAPKPKTTNPFFAMKERISSLLKNAEVRKLDELYSLAIDGVEKQVETCFDRALCELIFNGKIQMIYPVDDTAHTLVAAAIVHFPR